jgi:hypothetical protein
VTWLLTNGRRLPGRSSSTSRPTCLELVRTQTRRQDVRLYLREVAPADRDVVEGLPVTRAHRIVADLLAAHEDGSAVATIAVDAVRRGLATPARIAVSVAPLARRGLATPARIAVSVAPLARRYHSGDGEALARQLLADAA